MHRAASIFGDYLKVGNHARVFLLVNEILIRIYYKRGKLRWLGHQWHTMCFIMEHLGPNGSIHSDLNRQEALEILLRFP